MFTATSLRDAVLAVAETLRGDPNPDCYYTFLERIVAKLRPRMIVEIGTAAGHSAIAMALGARTHGGKVVTIDLDRRPHILPPDVEHIQGDSAAVARTWDRGPLDLLYIDGDHSAEGFAADWQHWVPLVRPGGVVILDDINQPGPQATLSHLKETVHDIGWLHRIPWNGRDVTGFGFIIAD